MSRLSGPEAANPTSPPAFWTFSIPSAGQGMPWLMWIRPRSPVSSAAEPMTIRPLSVGRSAGVRMSRHANGRHSRGMTGEKVPTAPTTTVVSGLEGSLGKRTYLCGNPDCGTLIIFHNNEPRPIVCHRCGAEIDWEGEFITTIRLCPKCNKEYDVSANYCPFHSPPVSLVEKGLEKHGSSFL